MRAATRAAGGETAFDALAVAMGSRKGVVLAYRPWSESPMPAARGGRTTYEETAVTAASLEPHALDDLTRTAGAVRAAVERVIEGKPDVVRTALTVLLAEGHLLVEDVPGVGKTMLAKAM